MSSRPGQPDVPEQAEDDGPARSLLGIALAALWADGREREAEVGALREEVDRLEAFAAIDAAELTGLAVDLREAYAADGLEAFLTSCAEDLEAPVAIAGLTLATDVVMADREVTQEELDVLARIREHLAISQEHADRIAEVLETKHRLALEPTEPEPTAAAPGGTIAHAEASLAIAIGAVRAATPDGGEPDPRTLAPLRARGGMSEQGFEAMRKRVEHRLAEQDPESYIAACAERLEDDAREYAFAWAADIALADRRLTAPEHAYLTEIREPLGIEPSRASRIVDVLWAKHLR